MRKAVNVGILLLMTSLAFSDTGQGAFGSFVNYLKKVGTNVVPSATSTYALGSASKIWSVVYASQVVTSGKRTITPGTQTGITISSSIVITSEFMCVQTTGSIVSTAAPLISTATATNPDGTIVTLQNEHASNVFVIQDQGTLTNSCLSLGATTRTIGPGDKITLQIRSGVWSETGGFVNNQ